MQAKGRTLLRQKTSISEYSVTTATFTTAEPFSVPSLTWKTVSWRCLQIVWWLLTIQTFQTNHRNYIRLFFPVLRRDCKGNYQRGHLPDRSISFYLSCTSFMLPDKDTAWIGRCAYAEGRGEQKQEISPDENDYRRGLGLWWGQRGVTKKGSRQLWEAHCNNHPKSPHIRLVNLNLRLPSNQCNYNLVLLCSK